jgi:hypothetical protein
VEVGKAATRPSGEWEGKATVSTELNRDDFSLGTRIPKVRAVPVGPLLLAGLPHWGRRGAVLGTADASGPAAERHDSRNAAHHGAGGRGRADSGNVLPGSPRAAISRVLPDGS